MTDYLLVHGAGQGAWSWSRVWGYLTAPVGHPPRLYASRPAGRVYPLDLPGHGADAHGDTAEVRLEECVHAIVRAVEREELEDVVLVGHGFAGGLLLQAAAALPKPPKRLVLVGAIVPVNQRNMLSALPQRVRAGFRLLAALSKLSRQNLKFPRLVIGRFLCNGMDPMEIILSLGFFGPLPVRVMKTKLDLGDGPPPCPVTYVVLNQDKVVPPERQERMAQRLPGVEIVPVDSCHQVTLYRPRELAEILRRYA
ncbi:MAG: alpha/beta hydrolase [Dehalococcoidia bacterium]|jgi:pimeloyl-ACP methyl ester carboxylesterase|nr:alpha/beta hydrolase [Dehalococcoidia bacterium]